MHCVTLLFFYFEKKIEEKEINRNTSTFFMRAAIVRKIAPVILDEHLHTVNISIEYHVE